MLPSIDPHDRDHRLVDRPGDLREALEALEDVHPVGLDVERADWQRYWRRAALIQVGGSGHVVLVDPIALPDLTRLESYLSTRLVVLHAMENDLPPLAAVGVTPPRVADTAIAAALLGLPTGLEILLEQILGLELESDKQAMQRADWEARPLDPDMLTYAAADVTGLPELWAVLHTRLVESGRLAWYEEELAAQRVQPPVEERRHWERVKGVGRLDAQAQGRARALWETRERLARHTDTAPARIIADKVLVQLAVNPPPSARELPRRGIRRQSARRFSDEIMSALATAVPVTAGRRDRRLTDADRKAAEELREIRAAHARDLGIDPGILCPSRTLMGAVLSDPATPAQLEEALGLRDWQWRLLAGPFCDALGIDGDGKAEADAPTKEGDADG